MPEQVVRATRAAVCAVFLVVAAGACESSTELPSAPDGDIPFNAVAINSHTVQPSPGTALNAGTSGNSFHADVAFQITTQEFNRAGNPLFLFWIETWSAGGSVWEGDLHQEVIFENRQTGVRTFDGTFSLPTLSPFCSAFSEVAVAVWLLTAVEDEREAVQSEKAADQTTFERMFANVNGASGTTADCMQHIVWHDDVPWWWGESISLWARNIDPAASVRFLVGPEQRDATIITSSHGLFDGTESVFTVWLPAASDGQVTMLVDGVQVPVYGANRRTNIDYDGDEDIFWPNDRFDFPAFDWIAWSYFDPARVYVWNPNLSIHAPEQEVDAAANPLGTEVWMKGDWYSVWLDEIESATVDVCSWIFFNGADDLDLLIFDDQGTLLDFSTQGGTTSEFVRVNGVAAGTELRLWVAPYSLGTASGVYQVISVDCALFGLNPEAMTEAPDPSALLESGAVRQLEESAADVRSYTLTGADVKARTTGAVKDDLELH